MHRSRGAHTCCARHMAEKLRTHGAGCLHSHVGARCVAQVVWINLNDSPLGEVRRDFGLTERDRADYGKVCFPFVYWRVSGFIPRVALCRSAVWLRFGKHIKSARNAIEKVVYFDFFSLTPTWAILSPSHFLFCSLCLVFDWPHEFMYKKSVFS